MLCSQVCRGDTETDGEGDCILAQSGVNENKKKRQKTKGVDANETGKFIQRKMIFEGLSSQEELNQPIPRLPQDLFTWVRSQGSLLLECWNNNLVVQCACPPSQTPDYVKSLVGSGRIEGACFVLVSFK